MTEEKYLKIFTDGGARGNPGPAAIGVYILCNDKEILKLGKRIGEATNNVAEYTAVMTALEWVIENLPRAERLEFFLDSSLAVNQLNGIFKIKEEHLRNLIVKIKNLEKKLAAKISYQHIYRERNHIADSLVNSVF